MVLSGIATQHPDDGCSRSEVLAVHLFTLCFNLFARWHQICGSRGGEFDETCLVYDVESCQMGWGSISYSFVSDSFAVGCIV